MTLMVTPKELIGKVSYCSGSVKINEGQTLTEEEKKIFEEFKKDVEYSVSHRFD
ncbi:MAG: hypothetical protein Q4C49_10750 [Bacillota bacterium]|nr:hypothetical protein [Bacillota bacterium]